VVSWLRYEWDGLDLLRMDEMYDGPDAGAGLDAETTLRAIGGGAAGCWTLESLAPRMVKGDYAPGFYVERCVKDMGLALGEAERMGVAAPGLALAHQLYVAVRARGNMLLHQTEQLANQTGAGGGDRCRKWGLALFSPTTGKKGRTD